MNVPFSPVNVRIAIADLGDPRERASIEAYVAEMAGSPFHRPAWLRAVERGTRQRAHGLIALRRGIVCGWLPLTEVRSPIFPAALVSTGFAVAGGPLSDSASTSSRLCETAVELAERLSCASVELRGPHAPADWNLVTGKHANFSAPIAADDDAQLLSIPRKQRAEVRKGLERPFTPSVGSTEHDRAAH
jgi:hypothetical protein